MADDAYTEPGWPRVRSGRVGAVEADVKHLRGWCVKVAWLVQAMLWVQLASVGVLVWLALR